MFTSILFATLFTAVSALQVDHPHANSSSSLDNDNGSRLRARQHGICGADDSMEAKCAKTKFPMAYYHSKAVLRISRNGNMLCTAFLVGNEGHIITNNHCLNNAEAETFNFEAMAEGPTCATNCKQGMACPGIFFKDPVKFVATGGSLQNDWTILKLSGNDNSRARNWGLPRLKIRKSGARVGETVYTAGHPLGQGKRISVLGPGGYAKILQIKQNTFGGGPKQTLFSTDIAGGASGSPLLSLNGHEVVAIVNAGGCTTTGYNQGYGSEAFFQMVGNSLPASCWVD
jgi:S1-C subfamily serine protease